MPDASLPNAVTTLSEHPHVDVLAEFVRSVAFDAAAARRSDFASRFHTAPPASGGSVQVSQEDANTPLGNVRAVLERGIENPDEQNLLGALLALGVARALPEGEQQLQTMASNLVWLAAHTPCSALEFLDDALWFFDKSKPKTPSREARDPSVAKRLWDVSDELVARGA